MSNQAAPCLERTHTRTPAFQKKGEICCLLLTETSDLYYSQVVRYLSYLLSFMEDPMKRERTVGGVSSGFQITPLQARGCCSRPRVLDQIVHPFLRTGNRPTKALPQVAIPVYNLEQETIPNHNTSTDAQNEQDFHLCFSNSSGLSRPVVSPEAPVQRHQVAELQTRTSEPTLTMTSSTHPLRRDHSWNSFMPGISNISSGHTRRSRGRKSLRKYSTK
ncbi:hypothetical protein Leryth_022789 [Lithospermum erythrorhizon]|nr:hypothetical protein Leryth_022789 [Lithospermum erythrorhizon]